MSMPGTPEQTNTHEKQSYTAGERPVEIPVPVERGPFESEANPALFPGVDSTENGFQHATKTDQIPVAQPHPGAIVAKYNFTPEQLEKPTKATLRLAGFWRASQEDLRLH